jgi:uncharacterized Zn finger protein (UPF0148 family)
MAKIKYKQGYCDWCGRYVYYLPGEVVCAACSEDPDYLAVQANNRAVERRMKAKKFVRTHFPIVEE